MNLVGVVLQLSGLIIAVVALGWEVWAAKNPKPLDLPDPMARLSRIANPWSGQTRGGLPLSRMVNISTGRGAIDGQLQRVGQLLAEQVDADRARARDGWDAQTAAVAALASANQAIVVEQLLRLTEAQRDMHVRVMIEMAGLAMAILGTVVASL